MKRTAFVLSVIFAVGIAVGALGVQSLNAYLEPVKRTLLIKHRPCGGGGQGRGHVAHGDRPREGKRETLPSGARVYLCH